MSCAPTPPPSSSSSGSDDDPDSIATSDPLHHLDLSSSIFKSYIELTGSSSPDLSKIQSFLTSSCSGALSCLICLERIRLSDPTWSCSALCFAVFHLLCIQNWARQSIAAATARAAARLPLRSPDPDKWNCPKCRVDYPAGSIPKFYFCFCGKLQDPPLDPWILPHSCGEVCGRPLRGNCGHHCLLLCHPGPCPPCPKLLKSSCFCGSAQDVRRCGQKHFSCNGTCLKLLDCEIHRCEEVCHNGPCPPCKARGIYKCLCGKTEQERECYDRRFRCEVPCEKSLSCGNHLCEKGCHPGKCGECPLQGKRDCPCGKRVYEGIACDVPMPVCGATCGKMLSCGLHRCPERCHRGSCVQTCRTVIVKSCRCGSLRKEVPCYQDLLCERKCQILRDCGRHACKRRCCDGDCPPCSEICGRKLKCKNHKCPSPCHRGACAPCPIMVTISCACGETQFEVPCGVEMEQKPPKCPKPCRTTPLCRHASNCKPHRCHYGACPPCRLLCEEEYPCGHKCQLRCHGPKPPANPEFTLKPKKKKTSNWPGPTAGSLCPPCPELVWRSCVGEHIGTDRMMICSDKTQLCCENLCGNFLGCGNHYCTKTCHALKKQYSDVQCQSGEFCEECDLPCQKVRNPRCPHPCLLPCHPGECPPCKILVKRSCYCGSMVHVFECMYYNTLSEKEQMTVRSCGGPCHRKLLNCPHLCAYACHPGQCPSPEKCSKKVTVRCGCKNIKKEWICQDVQAAYCSAGHDPKDISKTQFGLGLLPCNSDCNSKVKTVDSKLQLRKFNVSETNEAGAEKHVPKRRRRRVPVQEGKQISRLQKIIATSKRFLLLVILVGALIAVTYYGYKSLLWLSDWMNEVEEQRQRQRQSRIYART